jgi:hypothetical protein
MNTPRNTCERSVNKCAGIHAWFKLRSHERPGRVREPAYVLAAGIFYQEVGMSGRSEGLRDVLYRVTGSVYVASDLIGRAVTQYAQAAGAPDRQVIEKCTEAGLALATVVETLEAALRAERLGPAA